MLAETSVETIDSEARLNRFNRLMQELIRGNMNRNTFQPWEIEILLDIEACQVREPVKRETLRRPLHEVRGVIRRRIMERKYITPHYQHVDGTSTAAPYQFFWQTASDTIT